VNLKPSWFSGELVRYKLVKCKAPIHQQTRHADLPNWLNGIIMITMLADLQDLDLPGHHWIKGYCERFCAARREEERWRR